ncbi:MAG: OmpA family protein [Novosphingobium sp.]|nr:OmpA family protein [Novosphingobium sp.]
MPTRFILATGALLVSTAAVAQAGPVAHVTSDQLVCQLSGDCSKADASLDTRDKPESRGFSIAKRTTGQAAAAPAASGPHPARGHVATPATHPAIAASAGRTHSPFGATPVGHADLSITFVSGSAALTDSGRGLAQTFLEALRSPQLSGKRFMIGGHTDAVGSRSYNLELSQRRAQGLVDYLVSQGANRSQFEVRGFGFDRPLSGTKALDPANRRVEVVKLD